MWLFGESVFKYGSFVNINRPTDLTFKGYSFLNLDWFDIEGYLRGNEDKTIDIGDSSIACDKCSMLFDSHRDQHGPISRNQIDCLNPLISIKE